MKVIFSDHKLKFKKKEAPAVLAWLSGLVHILAAIAANENAANLWDQEISAQVPEGSEYTDPDGVKYQQIVITCPNHLPALKAARRKVAAVVRLDAMP